MSQIRLPARHGPADPRHAHRCPPDLAGGTAAPSRVNRLITPVGRPGDRRRRRAAGPRPRQHRPCPGCRPATQQAHQCHVAVSDATHRTGRSALHAPRGRHTTRNTESAVGGVARVVMRSAAVTWSNRCWDSCGCAMPGALWMPSMRYTTVRGLLTGIRRRVPAVHARRFMVLPVQDARAVGARCPRGSGWSGCPSSRCSRRGVPARPA